MTLISFELAEGLRTAILPQGTTRFPVPQEYLESDMHLLKAWAEKAQIKVSNYSGWWTISDSPEWGRTLFGPSIRADVEAQQPIFTAGGFTCPLSELQGWAFQDDDSGGIVIEWDCGTFYPSIPVNLLDKGTTLRQVRSAYQNGTLWQLLKEPFCRYEPVSSLPVGDYQVIAYKTYKGFEGREEAAIQVGDRWLKANTAINRYLSLNPKITAEKPATLSVLGHGETKQGYATARVDFRLWRKESRYRNFNFSHPGTPCIDVKAQAAHESLQPVVEVTAEAV